MVKTLSTDVLVEVFGDYNQFLNSEGSPTIFWEEEVLKIIQLPAPLKLAWDHTRTVHSIRCHKLIADNLSNALDEAHLYKEVWSSIDDYGGCYNFRLRRKSTSKLSTHCWGISIDLDCADNPFGKVPRVDARLVEIFDRQGFAWGGNFSGASRDGMHFEFNDLTKLK